METPNRGRWSDLPIDILKSVLERLSFVDFHRAKIVCPNWYLCSKQTVRPKGGSPWLMLFPEEDCVLYNPDEDKVYKPTKRDFSGFRFVANCGKWFLVVDPGLNLYIIDLFSETKILLPPLESMEGARYRLEREGDKELREFSVLGYRGPIETAEGLRGVLWVDEAKEELEYLVVWRFDRSHYIGFCKNGYDHHLGTVTKTGVDRACLRKELVGLVDMVLKRNTLHILTDRCFIRTLDFSAQDGFKDVSDGHVYSMNPPSLAHQVLKLISESTLTDKAAKLLSDSKNIAVTRSGDVLLVLTLAYEDSTSTRHRFFRLFKRDPNQDPNLNMALLEVHSLGDEALFLDLGVTVPADETLGIEPNSIYFTRDDRVRNKKHRCLDIFVYNLASKTFKRFRSLSTLNLKDATWFFPS